MSEVFFALLCAITGGSLVGCVFAIITKPKIQIAPKPEPPSDEQRLREITAGAKWHQERLEAMAEECVDLLGCGLIEDRASIEAEICREVVYCGRSLPDARERLQELRNLSQ